MKNIETGGDEDKTRRERVLRGWDSSASDENFHETEINRLVETLELPQVVANRAMTLYEKSNDNDLVHGRSIESVATAAVYLAARETNFHRSPKEVAKASRINRSELNNTYQMIVETLNLTVEPVNPTEYIDRFVSEVSENNRSVEDPAKLSEYAERVLHDSFNSGELSGRSPTGSAASAIYAAAQHLGYDVTQRELAQLENISEVTIRNTYKILARRGIEEGYFDPDQFRSEVHGGH